MKKFYFLIISLLFAFQIVAPSQLYAQCLTPTQLSVTANSQTSVTVSWAGSNSASHYNIRYQTAGSLNWVVLNNVSSPLTLTGLSCGSTYVGQLQQVCYQSGVTTPIYSDWANITFTTFSCTSPCDTPTGTVTTNIAQNSAVLGWNPNIIAIPTIYNIRYHSASSNTWITVNNVTAPYQLPNLTCGAGYVWQVQQICSTNSAPSPWSTETTFSTLACTNPCAAPTGQTTTNISQNGAVLNWIGNTLSNNLFNIRYHSSNSDTWIVINNVTSPYQLGNLPCGNGFVWQVQQVCSTATAPSVWSIGTTFSTLACPNPCLTPTGLTATNATQSSVVLNWGLNSTTNSLYNIRYHSGNSTTWIVVNNVTMPFQLSNLPCGTGFEWQVQQICSTTPGTLSGLSPWSVGATFSTLACQNQCLAPTAQTTTNISQNGAVLNWIGNTATSIYNIRYHSSNSDTWIVINNVTSPYQLGNLPCSTGFIWQVQQVCSTATAPSVWSIGTTFSTLACPNPCLTPSGLTATNATQTSVVLSLGTNTSPNNVYNIRYHSANSTAWITINNITFPYQLSNLPCGTVFEWQAQQICSPASGTIAAVSPWSPAFTFTTLACPNPCVAPTQISVVTTQNGAVISWAIPNTLTHYNVQYHMDGNPNWTVLNNVSSPLTLTGLNCGSVYVLQVQQVCSNSAGAAIVSPWTNVTFTTLPCQTPCPSPIALETTNISQTGAVLHWGPIGAGAIYNIRYHSGNSTVWIVLNNVTMPYQLGNLTCGTSYEWQVQQVCSATSPPTNTTVSPWSAASTFHTLACPNPCATPIGLTATSISQTSAVLYWGPTTVTNGLYNIRYHSANGALITLNNVSMPYQLGNLTCGTVYEWQVQRVCSNSTPNLELSPWSTGAVFTTLACNPNPCITPTGLSTTNINQTSAVLHWGPVTTTTNLYNIRYRNSNATVWTIVYNVTMPYQLGNLSCSAGYVWQVQRICGPSTGTISGLSPWSIGATFSTSPCMIPCAAPSGLGANDVTQTTALLHWGAVNGAVAYVVSYRPLNNTSPFITVTTNTNSITISGLSPGTVYTYQVRSICANGTIATNMSPLSAPYVFTTFSSLTVFPNPASELLKMMINVTTASTVTIQLRDSYGQLVTSVNEMATEGLNEFKINTSAVSEGLYLLTIKTTSETITSKVFIKH